MYRLFSVGGLMETGSKSSEKRTLDTSARVVHMRIHVRGISAGIQVLSSAGQHPCQPASYPPDRWHPNRRIPDSRRRLACPELSFLFRAPTDINRFLPLKFLFSLASKWA